MARAATPIEEIQYFASEIVKVQEDLRTLRLSSEGEAFDFRPLQEALEGWSDLLSNQDVQSLYNSESIQPPSARHSFASSIPADLHGYLYSIREGLVKGDFESIRTPARALLTAYFELASKLIGRPGLFTVAQQEELARREISARMLVAKDLQRQAEELVASTRESASKASEAATSASKAAGTAGENVMASYFENFAGQEWESATRFRLWTIVLLTLGGLLAAVFLLLPAFGATALAIDAGDYVHLAQRVVVTAAVFAISAYLARQSHQHRTLANWAKALSVQLKTFDAFMAPVDSAEAKEALRAQFAARVFGEPPVLRGDSSSGDSSPVPQQLWDILSRNMGKQQ